MIKRLLLLWVLCAFCISCQCQQTSLSFEILDEGRSLSIKGISADLVPGLIIISKAEESIPRPGFVFPSQVQDYLNNTDFKLNFIMLLLRGQISNSGIVKDIVRSGDKVTVMTNAIDIGPGNFALTGFTPPYQVIMVRKDGEWNRDILFVLERNGEKSIEEFRHFIP